MGAAIDCRETDRGDVGADCGEKYLRRKARQPWRGMGGAKEDQPKRPSDHQMLET